MNFKKNKLILVFTVLFTALFLTGCSQPMEESYPVIDGEVNQYDTVEVTSDDIIEDIVIEDVEEDVELGELI